MTVLIDAELSVVSAAMKMCLVTLVQLHCDVKYPSDKRMRLYAFGAAKKNERRSVDWTMRWPARVKSRSFFVTTTAGEDETSEDNPENNKRDAFDVAPSVPAHDNEAAAKPTTAEPAQRGPVT